MPFGQTGGTTITATMGVNTQPAVQAMQQLPSQVKQALNQASTHTKTFSQDFASIFKSGDIGERRFHSMIASMVRDMTQMQGGAQGAATAVGTFLERLGGGAGIAAGAGLAALGIGLERLVNYGTELKKSAAESTQSLMHLGREAKMATAGEGFSSLIATAQHFQKEHRKAFDEAAKDREHYFRTVGRRAEYMFAHPLASAHDVEQAVGKENAENAKKAAEAAAQRDRLQTLAVQSLQLEAELHGKMVSGTEQEVANAKLELEYMQRRAEVETTLAQSPDKQSAALAALEQELAYDKQRLAIQTQLREAELRGQERGAGFTRQQATMNEQIAELGTSALSTEEKELAIAKERSEMAQSRISAAKSEVQAAEEQLEASKDLSEEDKRRAQIKLENARSQEIEASAAGRQAAGGVADVRTRQLEAAGKEEEMTPKEKWSQYWERQKQYEGLKKAAARRGEDARLIDAPKYGEAEYDPTKRYKAAAASEEMERAAQRQQTPEQMEKKVKQQESENPLLGHIKTDVSTIVLLMQQQKGPTQDGGKPKPAGPSPQQPPTPQGTQGGPQGTQGGPQPVPAPAPTPAPSGGPGMEGPSAGLPKGWKQISPKPGEGAIYDPKTGKVTPQATPQAPQTAREQSMAAQGIDPNQSMQYVDQSKLAEITSNKEAFDAYWNRPDVGQAVAGQAEIGRQAAGDEKTGFIAGREGDVKPRDDAGLAHQMDTAPFPWAHGPNKRQAGEELPKGLAEKPLPPPVPQPPQPHPSALPSPPQGGGSGGIVGAIKEAITSVMREFWK